MASRFIVLLAIVLCWVGVASAEPGPEPAPLPVILVAGQSNAFRLGSLSSAPPKQGQQAVGADIYYVANPDCVKAEAIDVTVQRFAAGQHVSGYGAGYAEKLAERYPGGFAVVRYAVCGSDLHTEWKPGEEDGYYRKYFEPFLAQALQAIEQSSGRPTRVVGVFWHQGESNSDSQQAVAAYREQMPILLKNFAEVYGPVPFILGEIREFDNKPGCAQINQHMRAIAAEHDHVRVIGLQDITWDSPTNVHMNMDGGHEAGRRFVEAWAREE